MSKLLVGAGVIGGLMVLGSVLPDSSPAKVATPKPTATAAFCDSTGPCELAQDAPDAAAEGPAVSPSPTALPTLKRSSEPVVPLALSPSRSGSAAAAGLLYAAGGGDGDSWKDRQGREYRMGLINTPEYNECYGSTATAKRKSMTANGFRAKVYSTDSYGRRVAVITTASGVNLNVYLARHGYANDKYLDEFRHENPSLATKLDAAFAAAKREKAGLWGACSTGGGSGGASNGTTGAATSSCHPDYKTCIPIKGDGSGNGQENDLDCGDIGKPVYVRQVGVDPYRLDADSDGVGCE
jgi:endonuclease YncB( thermonuclease family)